MCLSHVSTVVCGYHRVSIHMDVRFCAVITGCLFLGICVHWAVTMGYLFNCMYRCTCSYMGAVFMGIYVVLYSMQLSQVSCFVCAVCRYHGVSGHVCSEQ